MGILRSDANGATARKVGDDLRKFYKVIDHETGSSELVLADGHVDALSFYRKKNNVEKSVILECADFFVYLSGERYFTTKLSELPDCDLFYKVNNRTNVVNPMLFVKFANTANNMVRCNRFYDMIRPYSYFKGSTMVAVIPKEEQKCLKSGTV